MTSSQYWAQRDREQAREWLSECGFVLDRPKKKSSLKDYVMLLIMFLGTAFFWWKAFEVATS
jgi:hypothetical protein